MKIIHSDGFIQNMQARHRNEESTNYRVVEEDDRQDFPPREFILVHPVKANIEWGGLQGGVGYKGIRYIGGI